MNLSALILILLTFLSDQLIALWPWDTPLKTLTPGWRLTLALGVPALLTALYFLTMRLCAHAMSRRGSFRAVVIAGRLNSLLFILVTAIYAIDLASTGLIDILRSWMGDLILLDECLALMIPIAMILAAWWSYYPIARRWREATLIRSLDSGKPIYAIPGRLRFVLTQFRIQLAVILLPALAILGWAEAMSRVTDHYAWPANLQMRDGLVSASTIIGAAVIFLFAPVMTRYIWQTTPLASGDLRERLGLLCSTHKVRVRNLLLWHTDGGVINGAVMGLIGALRYILLTDALVDSLPADQIEAVMAHEIGHARRHHLPWLAVSLVAIMVCVSIAATAIVHRDAPKVPAFSAISRPTVPHLLVNAEPPWSADAASIKRVAERSPQLFHPVSHIEQKVKTFLDRWAASAEARAAQQEAEEEQTTILLAALVLGLPAFFWVNRRFERQADTFAVQHLSGMTHDDHADAKVTGAAVATMRSALQSVADLNHVPISSRSMRHGSIQWRMSYLSTLVGKPCNRLRIDLTIRIIKYGSLALLLAALGLGYWLDLLS